MMSKTYEELLDLQNKAQSGDDKAQLEYGLYYKEKVNNDKALYWISKSAEQGNMYAIMYMGLFYEDGKCGVKQDYLKASQYYIEAIKKGYKDAKKLLDGLIILGKVKGIKYNNIFNYYEKVDSQNDSNDLYILGLCYENEIGVKSNLEKAIELYVQATGMKNRDAMMHLADFLRKNYYWSYVSKNAERLSKRVICYVR